MASGCRFPDVNWSSNHHGGHTVNILERNQRRKWKEMKSSVKDCRWWRKAFYMKKLLITLETVFTVSVLKWNIYYIHIYILPVLIVYTNSTFAFCLNIRIHLCCPQKTAKTVSTYFLNFPCRDLDSIKILICNYTVSFFKVSS